MIYLNTPTAPPAARSVLAAMRRAEAEWEEGRFDWQAWEAEAHATRALFGRLIGADASSIALLGSVAEAAATVARSLQPPGRIVVGAGEFRSNLLPWLALRNKGFEVIEVPTANGVVTTDAFVKAIDRGSVLVAVTEVQSANGFRVRIPAIAARAHDVGARLFLSAMQSVGVLQLDVRESDPDFVVSHGYKWLLAPRGAAWLYVRPDRIAELEPLAPNWKNVPEPYANYYGSAPLAADARKLDASLAWFSWIGAKAALDLLRSLPAADIEKRALSLAREFGEAAERAGFGLAPRELPSQIVAVTVADPEALRARLADRRVIAAVRGGYLRVGFHGFNDRTDVQAALEALIASRR